LYSYPSPICGLFQFFYANWNSLQGTLIDAVGPHSLQITAYRIYEFLCHYLNVISKIFSMNIPQKFILCTSIILSAAQNHVYRDSDTSQTQSNMLFRCSYFFPMPQLTADCNRVVVLGVQPSDCVEFNAMRMVKLIQTVMQFKISEDYYLSDILLADYGSVTLGHDTKITPSLLKKYELCAFVSSTYIFCVCKTIEFSTI